MTTPIYLDHNATTPVDPRVLEGMLPYFSERFGNAASRTHAFGWEARAAVEEAREEIASLIGARPREIVFTSGATEANNLAILGGARTGAEGGERHVITMVTEHKAVLEPVEHLGTSGIAETSMLPVAADGHVDVSAVEEALRPSTCLVSIMAANNEIGVLAPLAEIGAVTRERGVLLHTDAAQAIGKIPFHVDELAVDLASISAHKFYGPKGVGCLFVRGREPRVRLGARSYGGGHERGLRPGTLDVPAIVGMRLAMRIAVEEREEESARLAALRERLLGIVREGVPDVVVHGDLERRLPGNLNLGFPRIPGESLVSELREIAVSTGSACTSADPTPSHVLAALGVEPELAHASIRIGIGRGNTPEQIDLAGRSLVGAVLRLRDLYPPEVA